MIQFLEEEGRGKIKGRGLTDERGDELQTYEIYLSYIMRQIYDGLYFLPTIQQIDQKNESGKLYNQAKYRNITSKLHIEDINKMDCNSLSWWEKQKVAIVRAMINNPEFIIADEPTGNLDRDCTQEIWNLLIEANKTWNTILLITHDVHLLNYIKSKTNVNVFQM